MIRSRQLPSAMALLLAIALPVAHPSAAQDGAASTEDSWFTEARRNIIQMEYDVGWAVNPADGGEACFQAPNRSQGLRFFFRDDSTVSAQPRIPDEGARWNASVQLVQIRRAEALMALSPAQPEPDGRTVVYRRGAAVHSIANETTGLMHEITIMDSPDGNGELRLHFTVDRATLHRGNHNTVELRVDGSPAVSVRAHGAVDALGRALPARLEVDSAGRSFDLVVDDEDAVYPILAKTIQGLPGSPGWYGHGSADYEEFGFSVSTAGDVNGDGYSDIVIGAPAVDTGDVNAGALYLYYGSSTGASSTPDFTRTGTEAWENLGHAVAFAGDVNRDGFGDFAVGCPGWVDPVSSDAVGAVYVYYGSATGPGVSSPWFRDSPHGQASAGFGAAVATAGDVNGDGYSDLLIGEPYYDDGWTDDGWVGLFYGGSTGLAAAAAWNHRGSSGDRMGFSVATAGDVNGDGYSDFVIGAPYYNGASHTDQGTAVVFLGSATGPQFPGLYLFASQNEAYLGSSVALAGDVNGDGYSDVIVGVPGYDTLAGDEGVAYLYYGASTFDTTADWFAFGEQQDATFGTSVSGVGDVNGDGYGDFVIGEPAYDGSLTDEGRALLWYGSASGPALGTPGNADWTSTSGTASARYGTSVAPAGDVNGDGYSDVLVGAPDSTYSHASEGTAFLFFGGPDDMHWAPHWNYESDWADANLGFSVAGAGDVNGDGYADLIAGAPYYDSSFSNEGAALLFLGSATGPNTVSDWFARGNQEGAFFGWSVNTAGDVNGDGYSDIVIGAPDYDYSAVDSGAIFVWHGSASGISPNGLPGNEDWFGISAFGGGKLGYSAASAGDVNGDGYADVAGGAPNWSNGQVNEGGVFVWHGSSSGLGADGTPANADWQDEGDADNLIIGTSLAAAGDVNGDGYSDLVAGGFNIAVAWHGSASGLRSPGVDWAISQASASSLFGRSIAGCGDVNGDGYADVVVGAPTYSQNFTNEGAAWAYCGSASGLATSACWWDTGYRESAFFGMSVAGAGDLNGDGYAEIAAGAPGWSNPQTSEGQVRVYYGSSFGPISFNDGDWTAESNYGDALLGQSVAGIGDVNGDGYGDLVAGSSGYANSQTDEGRLSLFYGNGRPGVSMLLKQTASDGSTPIAPLGMSDSETEARIAMLGRTSSGRGDVEFWIEIKPQGQAFTGTDLLWTHGLTNTGVSGVVLTKDITTLITGTRYHWRARLSFEPSTNPLEPPLSRWYHMPWNGWNEADFRTAGTTAPTDLIFTDGFETGNTSEWSSTQ
jgi:hypothetical protein